MLSEVVLLLVGSLAVWVEDLVDVDTLRLLPSVQVASTVASGAVFEAAVEGSEAATEDFAEGSTGALEAALAVVIAALVAVPMVMPVHPARPVGQAMEETAMAAAGLTAIDGTMAAVAIADVTTTVQAVATAEAATTDLALAAMRSLLALDTAAVVVGTVTVLMIAEETTRANGRMRAARGTRENGSCAGTKQKTTTMTPSTSMPPYNHLVGMLSVLFSLLSSSHLFPFRLDNKG